MSLEIDAASSATISVDEVSLVCLFWVFLCVSNNKTTQ